jgi:error-prone DNA polymerase
LVICRQRPQTKTGVVFFSLEDETGILNVMVTATLFEKHRVLLSSFPCLVFEGTLQQQDGAHMLMARRVQALKARVSQAQSHDWH